MLAKNYDHKTIEDRLYANWEEKGYFKPEVNDGEAYTIVMPPPNVTGQLHLGHAYNSTIQDILIRFKRMNGYSALWVPGEDHASIATEVKLVDKIMREHGKTKEEFGREAFLTEAWLWTDHYRTFIANQLRKVGCSCDWTRERFTMDEGCAEAVKQYFINLYDKGLIYRGNRIVNWCTTCQTTISDIEVEYDEKDGYIYYINYPIKDSEEVLMVATTRPETMLGDSGIAINGEDERYQHLIGKTAILPLVGREIPIFEDAYVDKEFGTGCVKVTPAHDPNDFDMGRRHNLEEIRIFDYDGITNINAGEQYAGLSEADARDKVLADLKEQGYFVKQEPYKHNVGTCYRCSTVIQPITSEQWFVDMDPLAKPAIEAVKDGTIKFVPKRFEKIYFNWMENIRDWCISRQLWWGHRIPVYYCDDCGEVMALSEAPAQCTACGSRRMHQDPDVLDTWFSSSLWPFSTMGWPEETADLEKFYPNNVLVTAFDIIFLWVARMIVSGYAQMDEKPFSDIIMHGLIRDAQGRKMSKSLGNGVDPLEVIEEYGADSLRLTVITGSKIGNDVRWNDDKLEANKNFMNKLYNAAKFILMNSEQGKVYTYEEVEADLSLADQWIISKTNELIRQVTTNIDKYDLGIAADKLYDFSWSVFCDWYIELSKTALYNKEDAGAKRAAQYTLHYAFNTLLKLMHPFIPFITEELFLALNEGEETIMIQQWPQYEKRYDFSAGEKDMEYIIAAIRSVRNARGNMGIIPSKRATMYLSSDDAALKQLIMENERYFIALCSAADIREGTPEDDNVLSAVFDKGKFILPLGELIDLNKEKERLKGEQEKIEKEIALATSKLKNESFVAKAPPAVVDAEKEKLSKYTTMLAEVEERLRNFK